MGTPEGVPPLLSVTCACRKVLRAKAEHAGKRAKCAGCGNVLTIPGPVVALTDSNAAAPSELDEEVSQWMLPKTPAIPSSAAPVDDSLPKAPQPVEDDVYQLV